MNKRIILILAGLYLSFTGIAQSYWQQEVNYNIAVTLNDADHSLNGQIKVEYINHSPDALPFIWFHLWPNGYKNKETALYKQLQADTTNKKIPEGPAATGYIDNLNFTINGQAVKTELHPQYIDVVKLVLAKPLAPGASVTISTPFHVQLPEYFSRMGHAGNYYMITQWYPKPAVYDRKGWHAIPYLDRGEFYSEFGSFDVRITLPADYVVAATGNLQTAAELDAYKTSGASNRAMISAVTSTISDEAKRVKALEALQLRKPFTSPSGSKTLQYTEKNIHDFAFFASKDFIVQYDTLKNADGSTVDAYTFHRPESIGSWYNSVVFAKDATRHYGNWLGGYPYGTVKALEGPKNQSSGGMEYPTVTLITSPDATPDKLDAVITHEVGHNWFYGMLATNERDHPWMDEGLNTYYQFRYEAEKYKGNMIFGDAIPEEVRKLPAEQFQAAVYNALTQVPMPEPVSTASADFATKDEYGLVIYVKTAMWMYMVEAAAGRANLDKAMRAYFEAWKFKHPYPEDLKAVLQKELPAADIDALFKLLDKKGGLK